MKLKRFAACAAALCAMGAYAEDEAAAEGRTIVYPLYAVTVAAETTNRLEEATVNVVYEEGGATNQVAFSTLAETEGALTTGTFIKDGRGFLVSSTNMVNFTGEIWIDEGAVLLDWSGELGPKAKDAALAGAVHIANGASIGLIADKMTSQSMNITNMIHLSGKGLDDMGAIFNAATCGGNYMRAAFKGGFVFEGDAMFGGWKDDMGDNGGITYQLNGHTLTFAMKSGKYVTSGSKFRNGHVVFERGTYYPQSKIYFYGGDTNTLTFKSGAAFGGYHVSTITTPWTLVLENNTSVGFSGTAASATNYWQSLAYDNWDGPVNLLGKTTISSTSGGAQYAFPFPIRGMLYGPGWFNVTCGWLRLVNPTNSFTGTIAINQSSATKWAAVGFHNATAWPEDNWNVFTNVNGAIQLSAANVRLPDLDVTASGGTFTNTMIFGTGSATARSLVKRGPGELKIDARTAVTGVTELVEGTLRLPNLADALHSDTLYSDAPGLVEHRVIYAREETDVGTLSSAAYKNFQKEGTFPPDVTTSLDTTNVTETPVLANTTGGSRWPNYHFVSYDGYIWNRSPTNETWSFALGVAHRGAIAIDGNIVCESRPVADDNYTKTTVWYYLRTNVVEVTPGPHAFSARVANTSFGTAGARQVFDTWDDENGVSYTTGTTSYGSSFSWPKNFGCVFNRDGVMSTNSACYAKPANGTLEETAVIDASYLVGGDGYLFTRTTNDVADCDFSDIRVLRGEILHLKGHAGSTLDINTPGLTLEVETLEGVLSVTNGNLRVTDRLLLDANAVSAGGTLKVYDRLLFGADAIVSVTEQGHVRNSPEGGWTAVEAEGGITLPEGWQGRVEFPNGKYSLSLSEDGKRLILERVNGSLLSIR